ncbi:MAG: cobyric acid synthase, partial [Bauldia sp.]|nr:cobyric acid synthase [Bauldia sp.]
GVIASLVGTHAGLSASDRGRIKGFVINKMRGDAGLFTDGVTRIVADTGWPSLGVVPWFAEASRLPAEDIVGLADDCDGHAADIVVAVPVLPRIANFDDLDPLRAEPGVSVVLVNPGEPIPGNARLVLLPGSKSTIGDLAFLRAQGWDIDIRAHARRGGQVLGFCGGFQMLGRTVADPDGVEGWAGTVGGLALLDVETVLYGDKTTVAVSGRDVANGEAVTGYEIHLGRTAGPDCSRPLLDLGGRLDGARSADGLVAGTYVHGIFAADGFRRAFLAKLGTPPSAIRYEATIEATLDALADHLERHIDIDALLAIAGYAKAIASATSPTRAKRTALAPR